MLEVQMQELYERYRRLYGEPIGRGHWRATFRTQKGWVHKLPYPSSFRMAQEACDQNLEEAHLYQTGELRQGVRTPKFNVFQRWFGIQDKPLPLAKCELVMEGQIPIVKMEIVRPLRESEAKELTGFSWRSYSEVELTLKQGDFKRPHWIHLLDGMQVGYTQSRRLVAFDYNWWW